MKKRLIACVLTCATLLMGTGFAYWTDLINVSATAETGILEVNFTEAKSLGNNFEPLNSAISSESAYDSTKRTATVVDKDNISFDITDIYPGHYEVFETSVVNAGTVAAKLGKVNMSVNGSNQMTKDIIGIALDADASYSVTGHCHVEQCNSPKTCAKPGHYKFLGIWYHYTDTKSITKDVSIDLPADATFKIDGTTFVRLSALKDVAVSEQLSNLLYLTNDSKMSFAVAIGMDPDAKGKFTTGSAALNNPNKNQDSNTQNTTAKVTMGLVWDQYNER